MRGLSEKGLDFVKLYEASKAFRNFDYDATRIVRQNNSNVVKRERRAFSSFLNGEELT